MFTVYTKGKTIGKFEDYDLAKRSIKLVDRKFSRIECNAYGEIYCPNCDEDTGNIKYECDSCAEAEVENMEYLNSVEGITEFFSTH